MRFVNNVLNHSCICLQLTADNWRIRIENRNALPSTMVAELVEAIILSGEVEANCVVVIFLRINSWCRVSRHTH